MFQFCFVLPWRGHDGVVSPEVVLHITEGFKKTSSEFSVPQSDESCSPSLQGDAIVLQPHESNSCVWRTHHSSLVMSTVPGPLVCTQWKKMNKNEHLIDQIIAKWGPMKGTGWPEKLYNNPSNGSAEKNRKTVLMRRGCSLTGGQTRWLRSKCWWCHPNASHLPHTFPVPMAGLFLGWSWRWEATANRLWVLFLLANQTIDIPGGVNILFIFLLIAGSSNNILTPI